MSPDEVIERLMLIGIRMTRQTLLRYEWQGLIPDPKRGNKGRGAGSWTEYPAETVCRVYAAKCLLKGYYSEGVVMHGLRLSPQAVKAIIDAKDYTDNELFNAFINIYRRLLSSVQIK